MQNFEKPLNEFTEDELQKNVNRWSPQYGALALYELQRRSQEKNNQQIDALVKEIEILKKITEDNAEISKRDADSDNRLARIAILVSVAALVIQFLFSIHNEVNCVWSSGSYQAGCHRTLNLGLLGVYTFPLPDKNP